MAPVLWANGAGTTRELASASDSTGRILWRISLADLARDAPFSTFPGVDRLFTALGRVRLTIDGNPVDLDPGEQIRFPGEAAVSVSLLQPTQALNVMTRRDACSADVILRSARETATSNTVETVDLGEQAADVVVTTSETAEV
ncbi:HutD family protein [Streptomyces sp. CWNU-1]|uniref:HutD family protein n=1 Tax=Streptomyces albipurpureus TaxID=2897419 RepID=A0ABT0V005_9ACTN|nr:HutD family protein [Streptomyces sp. CWNU-1]